MQHDLIDVYLEKQQELTAVEKFALQHDFHQLPEDQPVYQELIPKITPAVIPLFEFERPRIPALLLFHPQAKT